MKISPDCYSCFLRQALEATRLTGTNEKQAHQVLHQVLKTLQKVERTQTTPEVAGQVHQIVRQQTGNSDPYSQGKITSTQQALALYPKLKALIAAADNPLETAVRLSIAGNIIDLGISQQYDLETTIERVLEQPFAINDFAAFEQALKSVKAVLYLGDNTGETVFDRLLIETMNKPVTYVVKGGPILNDATREEALAAGLDQMTTVIDNGTTIPGTVLDLCSEPFRRVFMAAEFIIAKGQGNFEGLNETQAPLFFLLQAKCHVIAQHLGVAVGDIVLKQAE